MTEPRSVLIVGAGLIGTSIGLALRAAGATVWLQDLVQDNVRTASLLGAGAPMPADGSVAALDLAVVAVPPSRIAAVVAELLRTQAAETVVHVGSVQTRPQLEIETLVGHSDRFVGTHPMAGRERGGPGSASPYLFQDRPWIICPGSAAEPALEAAKWLASTCGAVITEMSAVEHDAAAAVVSHVPQLASCAVATLLADAPEAAVAIAGTGVRDVTRLAGAEPGMWSDIVAANVDAVREGLHEIVGRLQQLIDGLDADPAGAVAELMVDGKRGRDRLSGKHGGTPRHWAAVSVVIPDRPGALVEALTVASVTGVNVEDLRVEHGTGHPLGVLEMLVEPALARRLAGALTDAGWDVAGVVTPHD